LAVGDEYLFDGSVCKVLEETAEGLVVIERWGGEDAQAACGAEEELRDDQCLGWADVECELAFVGSR
jgi:hypothetical protein